MTLLEFILVLPIPLASLNLSTISFRFNFFIILYSLLSSDYMFYDILLSTDIELLGGLFQTSNLSQSPEIFLYSTLIPISLYPNAETDKPKILKDNKGKAGIYMWTHIDSGKTYIGNSYNLSQRFECYFSKRYLAFNKTSYIYKSLLKYGYSNFNLTILEFIDVQNLEKAEAKKVLLEKEQFYINLINPDYNLLKIAGSPLGRRHSDEARQKMSITKKGKYIGKDNPFYGKNHSLEVINKLSLINSGENNPMYGNTGAKNILSKKVYIYNKENPTEVFKEFNSNTEAAQYFKCHRRTIYRYIDKNKYYQDKWIISSTIIL